MPRPQCSVIGYWLKGTIAARATKMKHSKKNGVVPTMRNFRYGKQIGVMRASVTIRNARTARVETQFLFSGARDGVPSR